MVEVGDAATAMVDVRDCFGEDGVSESEDGDRIVLVSY